MGLGARLAIFFAAVAATTALVVGGASFVATNRQVTAELDSFLSQRADEIDDGQRDRPSDRRDDDRRSEGQSIAVDPDSEVQVIDKDGDVTSNSGLLLPVEAADRAIATQDDATLFRTISIDGVEHRMITQSLKGGGAVQVARSLSESRSLVDDLSTRLLVVSIIAALVAGFAGWIVAQRTTRPLRSLSETLDHITETQDFATPVPATDDRDEVGRLSRGFNRLMGALRMSREQQERLVQDAAHELRTPLTSMRANVEWLMQAPDLDPAVRAETLADVRRELVELNDVMAEIVNLATDSYAEPELVPTDLVPVVEQVVERFTRRTGRIVDRDFAPVMVVGDADQLDRAIANLLHNANKSSPDGSPIGISAGPNGVFVDDAGPGIPVEERGLVFNRFYRRDADRSKPGSGLGLSIVAEIVRQHGGSVRIGESDRGGARVGFSIPEANLATPPA